MGRGVGLIFTEKDASQEVRPELLFAGGSDDARENVDVVHIMKLHDAIQDDDDENW